MNISVGFAESVGLMIMQTMLQKAIWWMSHCHSYNEKTWDSGSVFDTSNHLPLQFFTQRPSDGMSEHQASCYQKHVLCLWLYSHEVFHADNKVYLPTQHVLGLQLK